MTAPPDTHEGTVRPVSSLPEWNDLPENLRVELVKYMKDQTEPDGCYYFAGDIVLELYHKLREGLPIETFPLFAAAPRSRP